MKGSINLYQSETYLRFIGYWEPLSLSNVKISACVGTHL
jgi:hypothetical protein